MDNPPNLNLPFFADGVFKPGQLAFFQLKDLVSEVSAPTKIRGTLLLRDGLPIIDEAGHGEVTGVILRFSDDSILEAYRRIAALDFLLTWNCRHLANANKFGHIRRVNALLGFFVPTMATPLERLGESESP